MNKKMLIILNYQREIQSFVISEINIAKEIFDQVIYITPKLYNDNSSTVKYSNVWVNQGDRADKPGRRRLCACFQSCR